MSACKSVVFAAWSVVMAGVVFAAPIAVEASKSWKGSVADEKLAKEAPPNGVITNANDFAKLIKAWSVADKVPEVNFEKHLVLVATTRGSLLNLSPTLDENGDLQARAISTRDLRPGFRYAIAAISKEGVKTVNGKELPK